MAQSSGAPAKPRHRRIAWLTLLAVLALLLVRALAFVLDRGTVKPGARGTIWLDNLGVY